MKHKVVELEGALLNAAVRKAGGGQAWEEPSTDWRSGGPIIEYELISLMHVVTERGAEWSANFQTSFESGQQYDLHTGPTPLIAAMRAYVASKFGDEVELP